METAYVGLEPLPLGSNVGITVGGEYLDLHNYCDLISLELTADEAVTVRLRSLEDHRLIVLSFHGVSEVSQEGWQYDGRAEEWTVFQEVDVAEHPDGGLVFTLDAAVIRFYFRAREVRAIVGSPNARRT